MAADRAAATHRPRRPDDWATALAVSLTGGNRPRLRPRQATAGSRGPADRPLRPAARPGTRKGPPRPRAHLRL